MGAATTTGVTTDTEGRVTGEHAERFAWVVVGVWVTLVAVSIVDPERPVPSWIFPPLMAALGYVFGRQMLKRDDRPPSDRAADPEVDDEDLSEAEFIIRHGYKRK